LTRTNKFQFVLEIGEAMINCKLFFGRAGAYSHHLE